LENIAGEAIIAELPNHPLEPPPLIVGVVLKEEIP
jgi:hypothetical protein